MNDTATVSQVHEFFAGGFELVDGKKTPRNGYTLANFSRDWKALSADDKEYFKTAVAAELAA